MEIYVVKEGDSIDSIAALFAADAQEIAYANQIVYPYRLAVGQALLIPETGQARRKRTVYVSGYAYPYIEQEALEGALPYLTSVPVFSYGFTTEGDLVMPPSDDGRLIRSAWAQGTAPFLVLTPFDQTGMFNNYLISALVNDQAVQQELIDQILYTMEEKGFAGINIDFEYILPQDRTAYPRFVGNVRDQAAARGYPVSVALAPKTSSAQEGVLYEGMDYKLLGEAADSVLLMTYEWGYTYGPPMAVAPADKVRKVVEYAITKIPAEKIDLGIPNYGYDWTLPFVRGTSKARTVGNVEAVQIAIENDAIIRFDQTAMSPYFYYEKDGEQHVVWSEDVRSIREKFRMVTSYGLRGMGYWQIMKLFRANWLLLDDMFDIVKY